MPLLPQTKLSQQRLQQASNAAAATNYTIPIAAAAGHQCRCCHQLNPLYRTCSMPTTPLLSPVRPFQQWLQKASNAPLLPPTRPFQQWRQKASNAPLQLQTRSRPAMPMLPPTRSLQQRLQQAKNAAATTN